MEGNLTELWLGIAGTVCVVAPFVLAVFWHRRTGAPYSAFAWGGLIFIVFQLVLRLPWQIPLALWARSHEELTIPFLAFSAFTAGLFEEVGRYLGYRILLPKDRRATTAVMYGLGHGGAESILLVGLSLLGLAVALVLLSKGVITDPRTIDALRKSADAVTPGTALTAVVERASAITLHIGLSLLVLQVFTRRQLPWLALAIAIHTLVDFSGVFLAKSAHLQVWIVELVLAIIAIATLYLGARLAGWRER